MCAVPASGCTGIRHFGTPVRVCARVPVELGHADLIRENIDGATGE
jgi:hypothetical protein